MLNNKNKTVGFKEIADIFLSIELEEEKCSAFSRNKKKLENSYRFIPVINTSFPGKCEIFINHICLELFKKKNGIINYSPYKKKGELLFYKKDESNMLDRGSFCIENSGDLDTYSFLSNILNNQKDTKFVFVDIPFNKTLFEEKYCDFVCELFFLVSM
ncbi:hypothetical protein KKC59_02760, partial [bacterium]|nr:hypothetical protein [bacterium]